MSQPAPPPVPVIDILRSPDADPALPLPTYASTGAAGADLRADLRGAEVTLAPGERALVPTGLIMAVPDGFEAQLRPRSGLALREGITLLNTPGTIDSDYRGEVKVLLVNLGQVPVTVKHGERIAQIVIAPVMQARFAPAGALDSTARGSGGFGSTGRG